MSLPSFLGVLAVAASCVLAKAQTPTCGDDPPLNPFLADSPWPTYHRNSYRQASTCVAGPTAGDRLRVRARTSIEGGTSPWIYLSDRYPGGERVMYYSNATHAFKFIDLGDAIVAIDSLRIDRDGITSFGWNMILGREHVWYTYDPRRNASTLLYRLGDAVEDDYSSAIAVTKRLDFADVGVAGRVQHYAMLYDGNLAFNAEPAAGSDKGIFGVLSPKLELLDTVQFAVAGGEITHHNAFPVAEDNSCYVATTSRLIRFDWDGARVRKTWDAAYDFVADGPRGSFAEGSGTTPTLMGWGEGRDQLIVLADGHRNNNLVAFWRKLPDGWTARPGRDVRFADAVALPAAVAGNNTFQSMENSPTVRGYEVAVAQFNGFLGYGCDNRKGVQKLRWDTATRRLELDWVNRDINMNGILTYSSATNLVYSSGKKGDCNYYLYALDWATGAVAIRQLLGPEGTFRDDPYYDAGNGLVIDEAGRLYFAGGASIVAVDRVGASGTARAPLPEALRLWPNPTRGDVFVRGSVGEAFEYEVYDAGGSVVLRGRSRNGRVEASALAAGWYVLRTAGVDGALGVGVFRRE